MRSSTDEPGRGTASPARREINQHMHRKHNGMKAEGTTIERQEAHEELHRRQHWDHAHDDYGLPAEFRPAVKDA
jgi:hypothetical protein